MTHPKIHGWTIERIAREAGVRQSTVWNFINGRLLSGWVEWRIRQTLIYLGVSR